METSKLLYKPGLLAGERILVTGGGTGLGREMAEAFLALGATVFICGRRGAVLQATAAELTATHGGRVIPLPCDIRDPDSITAMVDSIWTDGGALTGLVNNAAGNFVSRTQDLSPRAFDSIANIVFRGSFFTTLDIGKRWIAEGSRGNVLSILTTWVWNGSPFTVPSAMSKAGLHAMTQSLAVEWGRYGIRFNAIAPGPFPTKGAWDRLSLGKGEDYSANPMGRPGQMHELCNLAVFLLAPGAEYVDGQTIAIDGAAFQATGANFSGLRKMTETQWEDMRAAIKSANDKDKAKRTV
jgi:NAD(P)-dependent dehydrogenase (short-subunit alcohol dehydrogenase family)